MAVRQRAPGDGPAFAKASAVAYKAMADNPAGKHICAHAQELITFSRERKTDWGKKRGIFGDFFEPQMDTDEKRRNSLMERRLAAKRRKSKNGEGLGRFGSAKLISAPD